MDVFAWIVWATLHLLLIVGFTIEAFGIYFAHRTEKQNRDIY